MGFHCTDLAPICFSGLLHSFWGSQHFLVNSVKMVNTALISVLLVTDQSYKFVDTLLIIGWQLISSDYICKPNKQPVYVHKLEMNVDILLFFFKWLHLSYCDSPFLSKIRSLKYPWLGSFSNSKVVMLPDSTLFRCFS